MGLPEQLDEETTKKLTGDLYESTEFESMSAATPGFISREQLLLAAKKRGLSVNLRKQPGKNHFPPA